MNIPLTVKALDTLEGTRGLERLVKEFYKHAIERVLRIGVHGSYLKVTETHLPHVYELLQEACANIRLANVPNIYIEQGFGIHAHTVGYRNPMIVVSRRSIDWLSDEELLGINRTRKWAYKKWPYVIS